MLITSQQFSFYKYKLLEQVLLKKSITGHMLILKAPSSFYFSMTYYTKVRNAGLEMWSRANFQARMLRTLGSIPSTPETAEEGEGKGKEREKKKEISRKAV